LGRTVLDQPTLFAPAVLGEQQAVSQRRSRRQLGGDQRRPFTQFESRRHSDHGKVWPPDAVSRNQATTALSNIVSLDESPLLEGLIYAGTDDGLLQITEDGGKNWRKVDQFPGVPRWTYLSDVHASPRDANSVFVALNNWQRGDYKPYLLKSVDRGHTWASIAGDLPDRHDVMGGRPGSCERQPVVCRHGIRRVRDRR
jgi:hypothetical protein